MGLASTMRHWVALSRRPTSAPDSDGFWEALSPEYVWAALSPLSPGGDLGAIQYLITMRYHSQVGFDTRILLGTRQFFVRGVQNVDERNVELRLACEEVVTN